jgi:hypothetical protein
MWVFWSLCTWLVFVSFMIPVETLWIVIFAEMQAQIFTLYYFKIWIKKTLTLNIILCNMFLYLQVLINKKTSTKTKKNTNCNTVTDLQKVGLSSSNIWACISAKITIHNVSTGIINDTKTSAFRYLGIYSFRL